MPAPAKATGILGGSFDPVHNGHLAIARSFINSEYISKLWILLTPESPHKPDQQITDFSLRLKMLECAFKEEENVCVRALEQQLDPPFYTVQTLQYLREKYPGRTFILCMGADSLINFQTWHNWEEILDHSALLVAARPDYQSPQLAPAVKEKTYFADHDPVEISSTQIRHRVREGKSIADLVPTGVEPIINRYNLYSQ